jgi:hypothetical protein
MPNQVDGAFVRAPCPVPSCPACEPNSGSVLPSLSTKATRVEGADIVMQSSSVPVLHFSDCRIYEDLVLDRLSSESKRNLRRSGGFLSLL